MNELDAPSWPLLLHVQNPVSNDAVQVGELEPSLAPWHVQLRAIWIVVPFSSRQPIRYFTQPACANLSNWLDCAGASSPEWFLEDGIGHSPPPCSRISMINDGGVQVPGHQIHRGGRCQSRYRADHT
jgi:hypothetical protein